MKRSIKRKIDELDEANRHRGEENMNRQIFTYAPIISLVSNSRNSRAPINFNDSISKGRNKITCNNNRAEKG